ncbi:MAG: T9SS type A sorting domain-containing protein [Bacteroidetes bacterium]|nr:T9SS type A sorting domain-containing protein [Bacteroidota bacterium]
MLCIYFAMMLSCNKVYAQYTDLNWTFGDSCGMQFNTTGIDSFFQSSMNARGSCASISDAQGQMLFYASTPEVSVFLSPIQEMGVVYNKNHLIMQNGLYIKTSAWYNEMVILPDPGGNNQFYLFGAGVTSTTNPGLRYSKIDLNQNGGLGAVTQKNILMQSGEINDGIIALKHGNGRDWWLFYKNWGYNTDTIKSLLITPGGVSGPYMQSIGALLNPGFYRFAINPEGSLVAGISMQGVLELFDFDRCTGIFSNHRIIRQVPSPPTDERDNFWAGAFSANGRYLYVSTYNVNAYLFQFDLLAPNIFTSRVMLDSIDVPYTPASALKRGPDNRIYRAIAWSIGYPYPDSSYNAYNTHLSVINSPDSAGLACDYQPFSVYLPNCRTYLGLPNNPDYTLGPIIGSPCDTLTVGIDENNLEAQDNLVIAPNPFTARFKVSLKKGSFPSQISYQIYNLQGQRVTSGKLANQFDNYIELENVNSGMYLLEMVLGIEGTQKVFRKKIIKE